MERIRQLAALSVLRGAGFALLGIVMAMSGLAFDPEIAFLSGAAMMLVLAAAMEIKALTFHRIRRISETEVWILLDEAERPPKNVAHGMIVRAMRAELRQKALWSACAALVCLLLSVVSGLLV